MIVAIGLGLGLRVTIHRWIRRYNITVFKNRINVTYLLLSAHEN